MSHEAGREARSRRQVAVLAVGLLATVPWVVLLGWLAWRFLAWLLT